MIASEIRFKKKKEIVVCVNLVCRLIERTKHKQSPDFTHTIHKADAAITSKGWGCMAQLAGALMTSCIDNDVLHLR